MRPPALPNLQLDSTQSFSKKVYSVVQNIPAGRVATYSQIATIIGHPNSARAVGNALHNNPDDTKIPCHRVVNSKGKLAENFAFSGAEEQMYRLAQEGVKVTKSGTSYFVDLQTYDITV